MLEPTSSLTCQQNTPIDNRIYRSFQNATRRLEAILPVDYFFAQELSQCINFGELEQSDNLQSENILRSNQSQWFHLLIALSVSLRDGHSCLPLSQVAGKRLFISSANENTIKRKEDEINEQGFMFTSLQTLLQLVESLPLKPADSQPIVLINGSLYLRRYYQFEEDLKQVVLARRRIDNLSEHSIETIKNIVSTLFPGLTNKQDSENTDIDWQAVAVANAINKNFAIIAGGPGTGKTYTVTKLLAALIMLSYQANNKANQGKHTFTGPNIALVAPTGKAAQRLSESIVDAVERFRGSIDDQILDLIPENAQTIHRLLGVIPEQVNFRHHQDNQLAVDILLIDEVSMVDLPMMTRIFRALPPTTKVILLGDADQLPSVAVGSVLADFAPRPHAGYSEVNYQYLAQVTGYQKGITPSAAIACNKQYSTADCVTFLQKSRRFDGQGGIGRVANLVIQGQYQQSWQLLTQSEANNDKQLNLLNGHIDQWLRPLVEQYYLGLSQCNNVEEAFALLAKFRILSSTRKGPQGVENLNKLVTDILRDRGAIPFNSFDTNNTLYASQPIMITENDYRLGVYNGDIALLWRNKQGHLMAVFENAKSGNMWILPSRLPKFDTVYAMTIHKTQGSEFEHVAMVLPEQSDNKLLSRELLYTGITRAKKQLSIASSQHVWQLGVSQQVKRYSGLALD